MINGIPILGHQEPGGDHRADRPPAAAAPGHAGAGPDHLADRDGRRRRSRWATTHDHIHVGFQPLFGTNKKHGIQALAVLKPDQWGDLIARLREIDNPTVPDQDVEVRDPGQEGPRASDAHQGE